MIAEFIAKIRSINRRYATPRIEMSGTVRLALLSLRIYLLVLVGLLVYKFVITVAG
jgi:hypothetical protein